MPTGKEEIVQSTASRLPRPSRSTAAAQQHQQAAAKRKKEDSLAPDSPNYHALRNRSSFPACWRGRNAGKNRGGKNISYIKACWKPRRVNPSVTSCVSQTRGRIEQRDHSLGAAQCMSPAGTPPPRLRSAAFPLLLSSTFPSHVFISFAPSFFSFSSKTFLPLPLPCRPSLRVFHSQV